MLFIGILSLITAKAVKSIEINHIQFTRISFLILLYAGSLCYNVLYIQSIGSGIGIYNGYFHINTITQSIEMLMLIVGGVILLAWPNLIKNNNVAAIADATPTEETASIGDRDKLEISGDKYSTNYSIVILFSILGSSLLISSFDLISIYLCIELQSFGLYVLATLYRNSETSTSAGLKYFLLGALSSCIILLGSGIVYAYSGLTNLESLYLLNSTGNFDVNQIITINISAVADASAAAAGNNTNNYAIPGIFLGIIIIFIGFLFKIAAAPLHNWSPDVYDGVPTIVTTYLTIIPKISILFLFLEIQYNLYGIFNDIAVAATAVADTANIISNFSNNEITVLKNLLLISSLLSLIIGSLLGLSQIKLKRLLAYSTISHIGFILLALAINTEQSIDSFIFYIIQYTITNLNIFLIILALSYNLFKKEGNIQMNETNKDINYIYQLAQPNGLFAKNPLLCLSLAVCLFSMAGIPPFIGFFSKQFVLYSALQNGYYFISIIAIIVSVISASYYLQIIKNMYNFDESIAVAAPASRSCEEGVAAASAKNLYNPLSNIHSYIISILTLIIIFFFIKPAIILNGTQLLSLSLFFN